MNLSRRSRHFSTGGSVIHCALLLYSSHRAFAPSIIHPTSLIAEYQWSLHATHSILGSGSLCSIALAFLVPNLVPDSPRTKTRIPHCLLHNAPPHKRDRRKSCEHVKRAKVSLLQGQKTRSFSNDRTGRSSSCSSLSR